MRIHGRVLAALAFAVLLAGSGRAQEATDAAVEGHLRDVSAAIKGQPMRTLRGRLAKAGVERVSIEAGRGMWYVAGVCDDACDDLNLRLLDSKGGEVMSDDAADKFPLTFGEASGPATFQVEIVMQACATASCAYGVRVYRQ